MENINLVVNNEESFFNWEELFFSYTSKQGIIGGGNEVFRRVSKYDWDEIIDRPHNLVRHPDMPRGIFYLFWNIINQGQSIGAFVKNRAKDGSSYWVFALASPIETGFISVRQKPGGHLFSMTPDLYKKWKLREEKEKMKPQESAQKIVEDLQSLGFKDYLDFSSQAFSESILARYEQLEISDMANDLRSIGQIKKIAKEIFDQATSSIHSYQSIKYIPLNMQIYSDNLGTVPTLSVVAQKYQELATEIEIAIHQFEKATYRINDAVRSARFAICSQKLNVEMAQNFIHEANNESSKDYTFEISQLEIVAHGSQRSALFELNQIVDLVDELLLSCENLRTVLLGLELIRMSARIEIAKMSEQSIELIDLMNKLMNFKQGIFTSIVQISNSANQIDFIAKHLVSVA